MFNSFGRFAPLVGVVVLLAVILYAAPALVGSDGQETGDAGDVRQVFADEQGQDHDHGGEHDHGGDQPATAAEREAADGLISDTEAGAARFKDLEVARAEGYEPLGGEQLGPNQPAHFVNKGYFADGSVQDPELPESLVYAENPEGGTDLIGVMYVAWRGEGPTDGGELAQWHTHDDLCIGLDMVGNAAVSSKTGACPVGSVPVSEIEMMHVWLFDHPDGTFAPDMVPKEELEEAGGL